jgi:hypothetical protein
LKIQQIIQHQGKDLVKTPLVFSAIYIVFTIQSLCRNNVLGPVKEWHIQDCIDVHKLLETVFGDNDAANSKFHCRCTHIILHV